LNFKGNAMADRDKQDDEPRGVAYSSNTSHSYFERREGVGVMAK
jgi:hypothetical protein